MEQLNETELNWRSSMSWHYYCWVLGVGGSNERYDISKKILCDHIFGPMNFKAAIADARKIGGGQMLTEVRKFKPVTWCMVG